MGPDCCACETTNKPSNTGFDCNSCCLTMFTSSPLPDTSDTYCMINLDASVLPAPDSPDMIIHWSTLRSLMDR